MNEIGARTGDRVVLGLAEHALLQGSAAVYLLPLASMMAAAALGEWLAGRIGLAAPDHLSIVLGLFGLGGGLAWLSAFSRRIRDDARYQPVLLRKLY